MYDIYQTEGIILGSLNIREANKLIYILSKNLGLIQATAQSIRKTKSKLKFGLQDFSIANISLVRGKGIWRITNVEFKSNFFYSLQNEKSKLQIISKILLLLKTLVVGEKYNEELYEIIVNAIYFLEKTKLSDKDVVNFENLILIRVLYNLGYFNSEKKVNENKVYKKFLDAKNMFSINIELLNKISDIKPIVIKDINEALYTTHLF
ncbi:MAG: DNA repair protein RecO [Candidatus Pacebacteria bacterium]|nr:DNA repair protein RecO [Candidatus Paceibacterota bacterium]